MRRTFIAVMTLLALTSCQQDDTFNPAAELPFATHPSVLRGNWSGTIFNVPESKNSTLELSDITAECDKLPGENLPDEQCYNYTFSGNISIDGSPAVPIKGDGNAGGYIYTLTSPAEPIKPGVIGSFDLDGKRRSFFADYRSDNTYTLEGEPTFEGRITLNIDGVIYSSSFLLEPTP